MLCVVGGHITRRLGNFPQAVEYQFMSAAGGMLVHRRAMRERTSAPSGPQPVGDPKATESKDLDTAEATRNNEGRFLPYGRPQTTCTPAGGPLREKSPNGSAPRTSRAPDRSPGRWVVTKCGCTGCSTVGISRPASAGRLTRRVTAWRAGPRRSFRAERRGSPSPAKASGISSSGRTRRRGRPNRAVQGLPRGGTGR